MPVCFSMVLSVGAVRNFVEVSGVVFPIICSDRLDMVCARVELFDRSIDTLAISFCLDVTWEN